MIDIVAMSGVAFLIFSSIQVWKHLPETIPIHFDLAGNPDGWGYKGWIVAFPAVGVVLYSVIAVLLQYPHKFNYLWPITFQNAERQYRIALEMMNVLRLGVIGLICLLQWQMLRVALGRADGVGWWPLIGIGFLLAIIAVYIVRGYRAR